jgi:hypothetical protein
METLRKIDCYGQLILASLITLSIPVLYNGQFLIGLFLLASWQLLSAIANTYSFIQAGLNKRIYRYWAFCIADLLMLLILYRFGISPADLFINIILPITIIGAIATAAYYWWVYFRFIQFLSLRNELDGLTKSKHRL